MEEDFFTKTPILKNCSPEQKSSCRTCAEACHSPFKLRIPKKGGALIQVLVLLDQISCEMQLDTGATVSIVPKNLYDKQLNQWLLQCTN